MSACGVTEPEKRGVPWNDQMRCNTFKSLLLCDANAVQPLLNGFRRNRPRADAVDSAATASCSPGPHFVLGVYQACQDLSSPFRSGGSPLDAPTAVLA